MWRLCLGLWCGLLASAFGDAAFATQYAVLVGIEDYEHADLRSPPLKYAVEDAQVLGEVLTAAGYQVMLLTDGTGQTNAKFRPTRANIDRVLRDTLHNCQRGDTVVIAFAGHGLQFAGENDAYFCPVDARPFARDADTLLSIKSIYDELDSSFAGAKVMLVDACRNDPDRTRGRDALSPDTVPPPRGVGVLFSCSPGQRAFENDTLKHGIFFYHVIEKLRAAGEAGCDYYDLAGHVSREVPTRALALSKQQQIPNQQGNVFGAPVLIAPNLYREAPVPLPRQEHSAGEERSDNALNMKLVWCPPGSFLMGSPDSEEDSEDDEKPQHRVTLSAGFWLGKYEVTQAEWEQVMGTRPWEGEDHVLDDPQAPATYVSWQDAVNFCARLTTNERTAGRLPAGERYTLPTEAQWEYACRAGATTKWSFGDDETRLGNFAWYGIFEDPGVASVPADELYAHIVGQKQSNRWELHDLHGNIDEWCADRYGEDYYGERGGSDPTGAQSGDDRVKRGGNLVHRTDTTRSASRGKDTPTSRNGFSGIRVSRTK